MPFGLLPEFPFAQSSFSGFPGIPNFWTLTLTLVFVFRVRESLLGIPYQLFDIWIFFFGI